MELFKYRNLALGSCSFLIVLFLSFYINTTIRIVIIALAVIAILLFTLLHLVRRSKSTQYALLHYTPAMLFVILAMALSIIHFDKTELQGYCDSKPHEITATVDTVIYRTDYLGYYEIELETIDGQEFHDRIKLTMNGKPLKRGDIIKSNGFFRALEKSDLGFDEAGYLLSHGITVGFDSDSFVLIGFKEMPIRDFLENTNHLLDERFAKIENYSTHAMLSALFLGNKALLEDSIKRDFGRIGLSHVLALSGMHITIIVTLFGYALYFLPMRRIYKELLLILATLIFVGITGFSDSAMRSGIMVCLAYTLYFFGNRTSLTSALFYSVSFLCICNPYNIFSLSLMLSFFAMLGCIFSSKIIHRAGLFNKIRFKILRFIIFTFICSLCACLFTLPLASIQFGTLAILSPITNIVVAPLLSMLIYLAPIFLIVADIHFLSIGLSWTCTKITELSTTLARAFSSIDDIVIPIKSSIQLIGILIFAIFLFLVLISSRKLLRYFAVGAACGILTFIAGTVSFFIIRGTNIYAGGFSFGGDDIIFLENRGELTVFDVSNTAGSDYNYTTGVSSFLGYYEIENYIITDYSSNTHICFNNLTENTIIKNVYLPPPVNSDEENILNTIKSVAYAKQITIHLIKNDFSLENISISFAHTQFLPRSKKRAVAFSFEYENVRFTYLGASTFEACDYFALDSAFASDIIIFGSYGPKHKLKYSYDTPYLDHCVFLGDSNTFASDEFYESVKDKISTAQRFLLTP